MTAIGSDAAAIYHALSPEAFGLGAPDSWLSMLCHGPYDTIAFIRFANRKSKYSNLADDRVPPGKTMGQ